MSTKEFIIQNLDYRIGLEYSVCDIQIGTGNPHAKIVVIQSHRKMPERDAITGALKRFNMLPDAYRATSEIIKGGSREMNRAYLKELLEIIRPLIVVVCGAQAMGLIRGRNVRTFNNYTGKIFQISDLPSMTFYATLDPTEYGYTRAPRHLKIQGKKEWTDLVKIYKKLKEKSEKDRWDII